MGKKKSPCYRIIVSDSRGARDGKYIENLGTYSPCENDKAKEFNVNKERLRSWIRNGAILSGTVRTLLSNFEVEEITVKKSVKKNKRKSRNNPIKDRVKKEKFVPKPKKKEKLKEENPENEKKGEQISENSKQVNVRVEPGVVAVNKTEINEKEANKKELEKAEAVEEKVTSKVSSKDSVDESAEGS